MKTEKSFSIKLALLSLFMFFSASVTAQVTVTGTVMDEQGEPTIGATVREKGTQNGTVTDFDGRFTVKVRNADAVLTFSYVGYQTQEVKVAGRKEIKVILKGDETTLQEMVVVGYGTMKKSDISGSSVSVGENAIKGSIITSLDQSLQGRAAGVTAVQTSVQVLQSACVVRRQSMQRQNLSMLLTV